jgi:hypothetical protein
MATIAVSCGNTVPGSVRARSGASDALVGSRNRQCSSRIPMPDLLRRRHVLMNGLASEQIESSLLRYHR